MLAGVDAQRGPVDAGANLNEPKAGQQVLAAADGAQQLWRKCLPAGDARGKARSGGEVPYGVAPFAQHLTLLVFVPAGF